MSLQPEALDTLVHYMHERERIRLQKDAGDPRPWTQDPILSTYKFTNVIRADDYTTRWLVKNWYAPNRDDSLENLLMNAGIARYFGTTEFCEDIGYSHTWDKERIRSRADDRIYNGKKVFTAAYVITNGGISDAKFNVVLDRYLDPFVKNISEFVDIAVEEERWEPVCNRLMRMEGFGGTGFMAKEILSDFILATTHRITWKDLYEFSPVGPGAVRGLNRLHGREARLKMPKAQALKELREVAEFLSTNLAEWMPQFGAELDLHGVQFQLCEVDKYMRAQSGEGRPKANYKPR